MERNARQRLVMAGIGGLAGLSLHLLGRLAETGMIPDRAALGASGFAAVFFGGWLGLVGPLSILRAALSAAGVALGVALLLLLASLRVDGAEGFLAARGTLPAAVLLAAIPLPFLVARAGGRWFDYPVLFTSAWTLVVRTSAAALFAGLVWAFLLLSDQLLSLVGLDLLRSLIDSGPGPWLVSGLALGLGLAVVTEQAELIAPDLILRLLRLLLLPALAVIALFLLVLPLRGFAGIFTGLSAATILIAMVAAGASLVTTAIDRTDDEAVQGALMRRATQGLALILPVPAALAAGALALRVAQYGWTPGRLFGATAAGLGLAYGLAYAGAVLAGPGWMARIRRGNMALALALMGLAALWLSPVLDPYRISARDQLARYLDGRTAAADLSPSDIGRWGRAGAAAVAELQRLADLPGHEALAARLASPGEAPVPGDLQMELAELMPVRPAAAEAVREAVVARLAPPERRLWRDRCLNRLPDGRPGCVMVVSDFLPDQPGEEALVVAQDRRGGLNLQAYALPEGRLEARALHAATAGAEADPAALIAALLDAAPDVRPAGLNGLRVGGGQILLLP